MKEFCILLLSIASLSAFVCGAVDGNSNKEGCKYNTIASYYPVYILSCELFKKRF